MYFGHVQTPPPPLYAFVCISVDPPLPLDAYICNGRPLRVASELFPDCTYFSIRLTVTCKMNKFSVDHLSAFFPITKLSRGGYMIYRYKPLNTISTISQIYDTPVPFHLQMFLRRSPDRLFFANVHPLMTD